MGSSAGQPGHSRRWELFACRVVKQDVDSGPGGLGPLAALRTPVPFDSVPAGRLTECPHAGPEQSGWKASPACSLGGSQPLQLGLGPQTCEHGNSRSASWVVSGVGPTKERKWKMHQRKQRRLQARLGLPVTQEDPVVSSTMALAQQLPGTLPGLAWVNATSSSPT